VIGIKIRFYNDIWQINKTLEHINGFKINSISLQSAAIFTLVAVMEMLLVVVFPILKGIPYGIFVALLIPAIITTFVNKVKLDGRSPIWFFHSVIKFAIEPKEYFLFRPIKKEKIHSVNSKIGFRIRYSSEEIKDEV
jgi:hypothetical protein